MRDYLPFALKTHGAEASLDANRSEGSCGSGGKSEFREFCEFFPANQKTGLDCQLTVLTNDQGYATKIFDLDEGGKLQKRSAANIYEGKALRISIEGLVQLRDILGQLKPNQALCFGVPEREEARLITQETLRSGAFPDAIARDRDHFSFRRGQPGVLMLDCDARLDQAALNWEDIDKIIAGIIPSWDQTQRLWRASSSAFIYTKDGTELIGKGGWRCYVMVDNAAAIPSVGALLYQELWRKEHGYIVISKSGQALDRSLIDASVWQPERIDFAAEPVLGEGLERRTPQPVLLGSAPVLLTKGLTAPLTLPEWRQASEELRKAKEAVRVDIRKRREEYITNRVESLTRECPGTSKKALERVFHQAVEHGALTADFLLQRPDGSRVTVGEILADPEKWHEARFADPLEPDYRNDSRIAYANLDRGPDSDPYIYSHAHGGIHYRLVRQTAKIVLRRGSRPQVVDAALALLRDRAELYERGGEMVRVSGELLIPIVEHWLNDHLGRHICFYERKYRNGEWKDEPADPPVWLCQHINAKKGERGLKELNGIITAPTLRQDGSLLNTPGYDGATGLLLRGGNWPAIPEEPTEEEIERATQTLWKPFSEFPFATKHDRAVMLAAILTAVVRRTLPRVPAFSFDAPVAGTGKTLLALCLQIICGSAPCVIPECKEEEEIRKRLLSVAREGKPAVLLDNIRGQFGSAAVEAFLTCETYSDRVLGLSQTLTLPTNMLFLFSGNNFQPRGDLFRRILTVRIDARTESPERRSFDFDPLEYCRLHRQELVAAVLTILRGFVVAGMPRTSKDRLASFEVWDDLIRQAVMWLGKRDHLKLGDPTACIEAAKDQEPERQKLAAFLEATVAAMADNDWRVADIIRRADAFQMNLQSAALKDALEEIAGERGRINPRILGRWIERHADTRCGGCYLERRGAKQRAAVWRIRQSGPKIRVSVWPENNSQNSQNSPSFEKKAFADFT
jgi:hypothetical protein